VLLAAVGAADAGEPTTGVAAVQVALHTWGGGPASLALMKRETTVAGWVDSAEFADAVAAGNALPGRSPPRSQPSSAKSWPRIPGAVAAAAGTVLPTTLLMLLMIIYFFVYR